MSLLLWFFVLLFRACFGVSQVADDVGWIASHSLQEVDPKAAGRHKERMAEEEAKPRTWKSKKQVMMARTCMLDKEHNACL